MHIRLPLVLAMVLAWVRPVPAAEAPSLSPDAVKTSLHRATEYLSSISTEGGYLWTYSRDLETRRGEETATHTQIWVQPPGTPSVGMAFLAAYKATGEELHLKAAQAAATALVRGQLESGGWDYVIEFNPDARGKWAYRTDLRIRSEKPSKGKNVTFFDDDNTQSALRFLMAFVEVATNRPAAELAPIRESLDYGLNKMIEAQYPNGAWPQRYYGTPHDPERFSVRPATIPEKWPRTWPHAEYGSYYTLNDHAQHDCIRAMLQAYKQFGAEKHLNAARHGGDFLILAQLPKPQPAWAQQYNFAMEPDWARAFEPPAVCSNESAGAIRILIDLFLETGDEKFLRPIPPAIDWFQRSQIGTDRWARYYELETNTPIYGDRDGKVHYTLAEISAERQRGYAWQGSFGIPETIASFESLRKEGREKMLAERDQQKRLPAPPSREQVERILSRQDSAGRWLANDLVQTRVFVRNMTVLADYLESSRTPTSTPSRP